MKNLPKVKFVPLFLIILLFAVPALAASNEASVSTINSCIPSGDQNSINSVLISDGSVAVLCPGAVFNLTATVRFTQSNQEIYTEGFPTDSTRAVLKIANSDMTTAVSGYNRSGVKLRNVIVDGSRTELDDKKVGGALILMGGDVSGQVVDWVKAYDTPSWSTLHIFEGANKGCINAVITNNDLGPAGYADHQWADGISLACRNSTVTDNTITDATDGAIVIFGAPGSLVARNAIYAVNRPALGGINMVDFKPFGGDFTGTVVRDNIIDAAGAQIAVAIAMGPRVWACPSDSWPAGPNRGATVTGNVLRGAHMGYGLAADGVENWTVSGNISEATHSGTVSNRAGCDGQKPARPKAFQKHGVHATGAFQTEFQEAFVESIIFLKPKKGDGNGNGPGRPPEKPAPKQLGPLKEGPSCLLLDSE